MPSAQSAAQVTDDSFQAAPTSTPALRPRRSCLLFASFDAEARSLRQRLTNNSPRSGIIISVLECRHVEKAQQGAQRAHPQHTTRAATTTPRRHLRTRGVGRPKSQASSIAWRLTLRDCGQTRSQGRIYQSGAIKASYSEPWANPPDNQSLGRYGVLAALTSAPLAHFTAPWRSQACITCSATVGGCFQPTLLRIRRTRHSAKRLLRANAAAAGTSAARIACVYLGADKHRHAPS